MPDRVPAEAASERKRFFNAAGALTPLLAVETAAGLFAVDTRDRGVGRKLFVNRTRPEFELLGTAMRALGDAGAAERARTGVFVDAGANIGTTTIPALTQHGFARALAAEPDPGNFRLLLANVELNGLGERVQASCVALSDAPGRGRLARSEENFGDHRLLVAAEEASDAGLDVEVSSVDALVAAAGVPTDGVGLLWIDVQGREAHVLAGAVEVLAHGPAVVFEFWPSLLEEAGGAARLVDALAGFYDDVVDLRGDGAGGLRRRPVHELAHVSEPTEFLLLRRP